MTTRRAPAPPAGLATAGRALWRDVLRDYELTDAELVVLEAAAQAADRAAQARTTVEAEGVTIPGRYGPRLNPATAVERDSRAQMLRALKDLGVVDRHDRPARDLHTPGPKPGARR